MSNPAILALAMLTTHVDALETNIVYDTKGMPLFAQTIVLEHSPATGRFQVRQWFMADQPGKWATKNEITGNWELEFYDAEAKIMRKITTKVHSNTYGPDTEREAKRRWPEEMRFRLPSRLSLVRPIEGEE